MCYTIHITIRRCRMGIVYQKDKRSGITYVYENKAYWDKEKKQSRSKRTLIGRLDEETGSVIPTDGRCKKLSPSNTEADNSYQMPKTMKELKAEVIRLKDENQYLKEQLRKLTATD